MLSDSGKLMHFKDLTLQNAPKQTKKCIQEDLAMQGVEQQVKEQSSYPFFVFMFISMECSGGRLGTSFPEHLGLYVHFQDGFVLGVWLRVWLGLE